MNITAGNARTLARRKQFFTSLIEEKENIQSRPWPFPWWAAKSRLYICKYCIYYINEIDIIILYQYSLWLLPRTDTEDDILELKTPSVKSFLLRIKM